MNWKKRHRSFYYKYAEDPNDIILKSNETAHLIIDVQKTYLEPKANPEENAEWQPFFNRMNDLVIPNIKNLISFLRKIPCFSRSETFSISSCLTCISSS